MGDRVDDIIAAIGQMETRMNARMDAMEERIIARLSTLEDRVGVLELRVGRCDDMLLAMSTKLLSKPERDEMTRAGGAAVASQMFAKSR